MPLSFPSNPTTNQTYTFLSITYTYDGKKWTKSTGGGGATVTVSATVPATTTQGSLWLDSDTGDLSVYSGTGWTGIGNTAGAAILVSDSAPTGAVTGNLWFNTTDLNTYVYYTDGINSQWVAIGVDGSSPLYTFPAGYGTAGQALTTNGTGTLSWTNLTGYTGSTGSGYTGSSGTNGTNGYTGSSSSPGGANTQIQYNNAGVFAGIANLTFDGTNLGIVNPTITNYTETLYSANTSTAITVSLTNGTVQNLTLTGNATITMPAAVAGKSFIMILLQDATGSRTVTWSTVVWPAGTAPTITSTASKRDIYSFFSDGTNWYGTTVGQNY
jgi:hypothetical protein